MFPLILLPICNGTLIPLYFRHDLTTVQTTFVPSRSEQRLSSNETNFVSLSNELLASTTATGLDLMMKQNF